MHRFLGLAAASVAAAGLVVAAPADAAKDKGKSYAAPFKVGPSGGDSFSYHSAVSDGTVTVGRVYPIPGAINCTKGGPYAKLLVTYTDANGVQTFLFNKKDVKWLASFGTPGNDTIRARPNTFLILGLGGDDLIFGSTIHTVRHKTSIPMLLVRAEK